MRATDLDVVAVNPVVAHFQRREPGGVALSLLQFEQVSAGILTDATELIEFSVVAFCDDTAVADQYWWIINDGVF